MRTEYGGTGSSVYIDITGSSAVVAALGEYYADTQPQGFLDVGVIHEANTWQCNYCGTSHWVEDKELQCGKCGGPRDA